MRKYHRSSEKLRWNHSSASVKTDCFVSGLFSNAHLFHPGWSSTWALQETTLERDVSRFRKETLNLKKEGIKKMPGGHYIVVLSDFNI